jgi:hypothetical protein
MSAKHLARNKDDRGYRIPVDDRDGQMRRAQERISALHAVQINRGSNIMNIPPHLIPPGWRYYWVRVDKNGEPDDSNWSEALQAGWTPVPHDQHPDLYFQQDTGPQKERYKQCIYVKGSVLCERPEQLTLEHMKRVARAEYEAVHGLKAVQGGGTLGNSHTPLLQVSDHKVWVHQPSQGRGMIPGLDIPEASFGE